MSDILSRVLRPLIIAALKRSIGQMFDLDDLDHVEVQLLRGKVSLVNVRVRPEFLQAQGLARGLVLVHGIIKRIELEVPWQRLSSEAVKVKLEDIRLMFAVTDRPENPIELLSRVKKSRINLAEFLKSAKAAEEEEADTTDTPPTTMTRKARIISRVLNNLKFSVDKVHLRFEFPNAKTSLGLEISSASLSTVNPVTGDVAFIDHYQDGDHDLHRTLQIMDMAFYASDNYVGNPTEFCTSATIPKFDHRINLMDPVTLKGVSIDSTDTRTLRMQATPLSFAMETAHVDDVNRLLVAIFAERDGDGRKKLQRLPSGHHTTDWHLHTRPSGRIHGHNTHLWWRYAATRIISDRRAREAHGWLGFCRMASLRSRYISLYKSRIVERPTPTTTSSDDVLATFESVDLTLNTVLLFRSFAEAEVACDNDLEPKSTKLRRGVQAAAKWLRKRPFLRRKTSPKTGEEVSRTNSLSSTSEGWSTSERQRLYEMVLQENVESRKTSLAITVESVNARLLSNGSAVLVASLQGMAWDRMSDGNMALSISDGFLIDPAKRNSLPLLSFSNKFPSPPPGLLDRDVVMSWTLTQGRTRADRSMSTLRMASIHAILDIPDSIVEWLSQRVLGGGNEPPPPSTFTHIHRPTLRLKPQNVLVTVAPSTIIIPMLDNLQFRFSHLVYDESHVLTINAIEAGSAGDGVCTVDAPIAVSFCRGVCDIANKGTITVNVSSATHIIMANPRLSTLVTLTRGIWRGRQSRQQQPQQHHMSVRFSHTTLLNFIHAKFPNCLHIVAQDLIISSPYQSSTTRLHASMGNAFVTVEGGHECNQTGSICFRDNVFVTWSPADIKASAPLSMALKDLLYNLRRQGQQKHQSLHMFTTHDTKVVLVDYDHPTQTFLTAHISPMELRANTIHFNHAKLHSLFGYDVSHNENDSPCFLSLTGPHTLALDQTSKRITINSTTDCHANLTYYHSLALEVKDYWDQHMVQVTRTAFNLPTTPSTPLPWSFSLHNASFILHPCALASKRAADDHIKFLASHLLISNSFPTKTREIIAGEATNIVLSCVTCADQRQDDVITRVPTLSISWTRDHFATAIQLPLDGTGTRFVLGTRKSEVPVPQIRTKCSDLAFKVLAPVVTISISARYHGKLLTLVLGENFFDARRSEPAKVRGPTSPAHDATTAWINTPDAPSPNSFIPPEATLLQTISLSIPCTTTFIVDWDDEMSSSSTVILQEGIDVRLREFVEGRRLDVDLVGGIALYPEASKQNNNDDDAPVTIAPTVGGGFINKNFDDNVVVSVRATKPRGVSLTRWSSRIQRDEWYDIALGDVTVRKHHAHPHELVMLLIRHATLMTGADTERARLRLPSPPILQWAKLLTIRVAHIHVMLLHQVELQGGNMTLNLLFPRTRGRRIINGTAELRHVVSTVMSLSAPVSFRLDGQHMNGTENEGGGSQISVVIEPIHLRVPAASNKFVGELMEEIMEMVKKPRLRSNQHHQNTVPDTAPVVLVAALRGVSMVITAPSSGAPAFCIETSKLVLRHQSTTKRDQSTIVTFFDDYEAKSFLPSWGRGLSLSYFNTSLVCWEPVLEPVTMMVNVSSTSPGSTLGVTLDFTQPILMNITAKLFETIGMVIEEMDLGGGGPSPPPHIIDNDLSSPGMSGIPRYAECVIHNDTSAQVQVSFRRHNGEVEIVTLDVGGARQPLPLDLNRSIGQTFSLSFGDLYHPVNDVDVRAVGHFVFPVFPKVHAGSSSRLPHARLAHVAVIVNAIRGSLVVRLTSTVCVRNATRVPLELLLMPDFGHEATMETSGSSLFLPSPLLPQDEISLPIFQLASSILSCRPNLDGGLSFDWWEGVAISRLNPQTQYGKCECSNPTSPFAFRFVVEAEHGGGTASRGLARFVCTFLPTVQIHNALPISLRWRAAGSNKHQILAPDETGDAQDELSCEAIMLRVDGSSWSSSPVVRNTTSVTLEDADGKILTLLVDSEMTYQGVTWRLTIFAKAWFLNKCGLQLEYRAGEMRLFDALSLKAERPGKEFKVGQACQLKQVDSHNNVSWVDCVVLEQRNDGTVDVVLQTEAIRVGGVDPNTRLRIAKPRRTSSMSSLVGPSSPTAAVVTTDTNDSSTYVMFSESVGVLSVRVKNETGWSQPLGVETVGTLGELKLDVVDGGGIAEQHDDGDDDDDDNDDNDAPILLDSCFVIGVHVRTGINVKHTPLVVFVPRYVVVNRCSGGEDLLVVPGVDGGAFHRISWLTSRAVHSNDGWIRFSLDRPAEITPGEDEDEAAETSSPPKRVFLSRAGFALSGMIDLEMTMDEAIKIHNKSSGEVMVLAATVVSSGGTSTITLSHDPILYMFENHSDAVLFYHQDLNEKLGVMERLLPGECKPFGWDDPFAGGTLSRRVSFSTSTGVSFVARPDDLSAANAFRVEGGFILRTRLRGAMKVLTIDSSDYPVLPGGGGGAVMMTLPQSPSPRQLSIHEADHVLQFSLRFPKLLVSIIDSRPAELLVLTMEGFEGWLFRATSKSSSPMKENPGIRARRASDLTLLPMHTFRLGISAQHVQVDNGTLGCRFPVMLCPRVDIADTRPFFRAAAQGTMSDTICMFSNVLVTILPMELYVEEAIVLLLARFVHEIGDQFGGLSSSSSSAAATGSDVLMENTKVYCEFMYVEPVDVVLSIKRLDAARQHARDVVSFPKWRGRGTVSTPRDVPNIDSIVSSMPAMLVDMDHARLTLSALETRRRFSTAGKLARWLRTRYEQEALSNVYSMLSAAFRSTFWGGAFSTGAKDMTKASVDVAFENLLRDMPKKSSGSSLLSTTTTASHGVLESLAGLFARSATSNRATIKRIRLPKMLRQESRRVMPWNDAAAVVQELLVRVWGLDKYLALGEDVTWHMVPNECVVLVIASSRLVLIHFEAMVATQVDPVLIWEVDARAVLDVTLSHNTSGSVPVAPTTSFMGGLLFRGSMGNPISSASPPCDRLSLVMAFRSGAKLCSTTLPGGYSGMFETRADALLLHLNVGTFGEIILREILNTASSLHEKIKEKNRRFGLVTCSFSDFTNGQQQQQHVASPSSSQRRDHHDAPPPRITVLGQATAATPKAGTPFVVVAAVDHHSPAYYAGFLVGDLVLGFLGRGVEAEDVHGAALHDALISMPRESVVDVIVQRGLLILRIDVILN